MHGTNFDHTNRQPRRKHTPGAIIDASLPPHNVASHKVGCRGGELDIELMREQIKHEEENCYWFPGAGKSGRVGQLFHPIPQADLAELGPLHDYDLAELRESKVTASAPGKHSLEWLKEATHITTTEHTRCPQAMWLWLTCCK